MTSILYLLFFVAGAFAGCQPEISFPPPRYTEKSFESSLEQVKSAIDQAVSSGGFNTTSFSLEVTSSDRNIFNVYHTADVLPVNGSRSVNSSTAYRIASTTKLFTALGVLQLEAAGKLQLDDSVTQYIHELPTLGSIDWSSITLRALLSHTSGIPNNFGDNDLFVTLSTPPSDPTVYGFPPISEAQQSTLPKCEIYTQFQVPCNAQQMFDYVSASHPVFPLNSQASYSNIGYSVLGLVIQNVTGTKYEDYVSNAILQPLGMNNTSFAAPDPALAAIPNESYFGIDIGVGNPSGGLYSSSDDMKKFLRYVLAQHNNISQSLDWLSPATFSTGSHSTIGYPWEIYRSDAVLLNSTRAVTFYTKGGGLPGYYSYSIVIPAYDLAVFMVGAGDVGPLNAVFGSVVEPLAQAAEAIAQTNLKDNYAGTYTAANAKSPACVANQQCSAQNSSNPDILYKPQVNSSMTLTQSDDKSLYVEAWTSNNTDALASLIKLSSLQSGEGTNIYFQLVPTFETRSGSGGCIGEVWRFINVRIDDPSEDTKKPKGIWRDYCIANFDPLLYAGVPLNEAVLWRKDDTSKVEQIELSAFQIRLGRT